MGNSNLADLLGLCATQSRISRSVGKRQVGIDAPVVEDIVSTGEGSASLSHFVTSISRYGAARAYQRSSASTRATAELRSDSRGQKPLLM